MPGSLTTPGRTAARAVAPVHIAFHYCNGVGTRDHKSYAAQWLACALPYRRFAIAGARLGADAVRYSFIVRDFHPLLLADLTGALQSFLYVPAHRFVRLTGSSYPHTSQCRAAETFTAAHITVGWTDGFAEWEFVAREAARRVPFGCSGHEGPTTTQGSTPCHHCVNV